MSRFLYDRVFILQRGQTIPDAVIDTATDAVNAQAEIEIKTRPSFTEVYQSLEGSFNNCGLLPDKPDNELVARFGAAWFTDKLGRKHVRVLADVAKAKSYRTNLILPPNIPYCTLVYSGTQLVNGQFMTKCKCGREGTLEALQWNGAMCWVCEADQKYEDETGFRPGR